MGDVAVLVVLLLGHSASHGIVDRPSAARIVSGDEDPIAGVATGALRSRLLLPAAQGIALHRLHFPAVERSSGNSLQSIVITFFICDNNYN